MKTVFVNKSVGVVASSAGVLVFSVVTGVGLEEAGHFRSEV